MAERVGIPDVEGVYDLDDVFGAAEVVALSTVKELHPVGRVDDREFVPGPVTAALATGFAELVADELDR